MENLMQKNDVTIIIPHYDTEAANYSLEQCLQSIRDSGFPMENVILACNGTFGGWGFHDVQVLWIEEQGQCKAVNAAAAIAKTPWIMVTNNDMIYPKDWFERIFDLFINHAESVIADDDYFTLSPILIEPRPGAPTFETYFCGGAGGDWDENKFSEFCANYVGSGIRSGFNLPFLIKRDVWNVVGGYDVNYDPWGSNSDSDFQYKLKLAGVRMFQNTNCPVYHFSQTSGTFEPQNQGYWSKNWDYFIKKWGFPRTDTGIWEATFEIPYEKLAYHPIWMGFFSRRSS